MKNHQQTFNDTPLAFNMIFVKGGTFMMGNNKSRYDDEKPAHRVTLSDYWIGEVPVTQALWAYVMQNAKDAELVDPSNFKGANRPVEQVSWEGIKNEFLPRLNQMTKKLRPEGMEYCIPTEAQWEYAARGGEYWDEHPFLYSGSDKINEVAWHGENSHSETKPVGLKTPNLLGIYDMSGNVWEWCEDWYDSDFYEKCKKQGIMLNPYDVLERNRRVVRGGSWDIYSGYCRSTGRDYYTSTNSGYTLGFRLALFSPSV